MGNAMIVDCGLNLCYSKRITPFPPKPQVQKLLIDEIPVTSAMTSPPLGTYNIYPVIE